MDIFLGEISWDLRKEFIKYRKASRKQHGEVYNSILENYVGKTLKSVSNRLGLLFDEYFEKNTGVEYEAFMSDFRIRMYVRVLGFFVISYVLYSKSYSSIVAIYPLLNSIESVLWKIMWMVQLGTSSLKSLDSWDSIGKILDKEPWTPSGRPVNLKNKTIKVYRIKKTLTEEKEGKITRSFTLDVQFPDGLNLTGLIALMGPTGHGKTTLLKILSGILIPDEISYSVDGVMGDDVWFFNQIQRVQSQVLYLSCIKSVFDKTWMLFEYLSWSIWEKINAKKMKAILKAFGLGRTLLQKEDSLKNEIGEISEGEGKRLRICRVLYQLLKKPYWFFADEPDQGLGEYAIQVIKVLFKNIRPGGSLVFTSHTDRKELASLGALIVEMKDGSNS